MKHTEKHTQKTWFLVSCLAMAAAVAAEDAIAQRTSRRSSSYQSSYDPRGNLGMGSGQYGLSGYNDPYGYSADRRSYSARDRYQRSPNSRRMGATGTSGVPTRIAPGQPGETQKAPAATGQAGKTTARSGQTSRTQGKPTKGTGAPSTVVEPSETAVDVAKPTRPQVPQPGRPRGQAPAPKEYKPQPQWPTLYLTLNTDQIVVGDVFSVDVQLSNPRKEGFDRLSVVLEYDPVVLCPVKGPPKTEGEPAELASSMIDEATSAPVRTGVAAVAGTKREPYIREAFSQSDHLSLYENLVDSDRSLITYLFQLEDETATAQGRVASIHFRALQPTPRTFISFRFAKPTASTAGVASATEPGTSLMRGDKDVLGLPLRADDGTIPRGITILSETPVKERVRSFEVARGSEEVRRTRLRLVPEHRRVVVGEEFDVSVELENPDHVRFDQVSVLIAYNPRVLEVIDYDTDNAVTRGINIHDGSSRDVFPFDFFIANNVNPQTGLIDYRMRGYRRPLLSEGVLATIRFQAIKSTDNTTLRILVDRDGKDPTTGVFYRLHDILGDSADVTDAIDTCSFQIGRLRSAAAEGDRKAREGG